MHDVNRFIKSATNPNPEALVDYNEDRIPDMQYKNILKLLDSHGNINMSGMDVSNVSYTKGVVVNHSLSNGAPIMTERDLMRGSTPEIIAGYESDLSLRPITGPLKQAVGEVLAFMNGARTQQELEYYGCKSFWKPWTEGPEAERKAKKRGLEIGDLGPGSYGPAFHDFPTAEGESFNQFENLINQINDRPELKTHIITPFIPQYISRAPGRQQKVLIVPCHGLLHFHVDVFKDEISLTHWQRSADAPVGLPFNFVHYVVVLMVIGHFTGYKPTDLNTMLSDVHKYPMFEKEIKELISRLVYPFPKLFIDPTVTKLSDLRTKHFKIQDYKANPPMSMKGTAV